MITGLMRVKNEARWIERSVKSILPLCDRVLVMDDHSTDGTPDLCAAIPGVEVLISPFEGMQETRDKNWLLGHARSDANDWAVMIDGDEILLPGHEAELRVLMRGSRAIALRVLYAWDEETNIRTDGVYGKFRRASIFRINGSYFEGIECGFHCGNAPLESRYGAIQSDIPLLHLGYLHGPDRLRKFLWYREHNPGNTVEDEYRHIVQGDVPSVPADARLKHAGPLAFTPLEALCPLSV